MVKRSNKFLSRVRRWLKQWLKKQHYALLMLFIVAFFATVLLTLNSQYLAAENSLDQNLINPQELIEQGRNLYEAERFSEAATLLQRAVANFEATGDKLKQAMTLSNLSLTYQQLGEWERAEQASAQSLNLLQTEQSINSSNARSQILAQALDVKGRLQLARGKAEATLTIWRQSADIYSRIGDRVGLTRSRINQAQALQTLGLYRQAQNTLTESTQLLQNQPDSLLKATALRSLGNVLRVTGNLEASGQVLQQSLAVAKGLQIPNAIADTLLSLGNTANAKRDTQGALQFYQQAANISTSQTIQVQALLHQLNLLVENKQQADAITLWQRLQSLIANLPPSRTSVYARINLAQTLMKLGNTEELADNSREIAQLLATASQEAKSLGDKRAEAYALGNLGGLYEKVEQWQDAQNLTQQALVLAQEVNAADISYRWQWQLGRLLKNQGKIQQAIANYDQAVKTLQSLRYDLVALDPNVQFNFRDEVEPVYREMVDLLLQANGREEISQENLVQARNIIESLQLAELENFFRAACLDAKPEQIDRVVDRSDRTAAAIYPIILPNRLEILLKLPNQGKIHHYVTKKSQSEIEIALEEIRQYLREPDRTDDVNRLSQQVYSWLIEPMEAELEKFQIQTLVFVLDGSLRNIPMSVLYDEGTKKYLLEKYAIALAPSLQLLQPKSLQRKKLSALTAGLSEKRVVEGQEFSPLENVNLELQRIQSELSSSETLLNQKFTKLNLENQINSTPYTVVHLATHGKFSSQIEETYILTWNQLLKVKDLDNLLRNADSKQSSDIELLVLSACETAAGDKRAALGLAGIAVRAGARSILATLWSVDDRSTAELMSEFYHQLGNTNVTKAEALRRAQIALWNHPNEDWKRPYFWASYVLVGNWL